MEVEPDAESTPEVTPEVNPEDDTRAPDADNDPSTAKPGLFSGWRKPGDAALKKETPEPKKRGRPPGSTNRNSISIANLRGQLETQFMLLGMSVMLLNKYDGEVIVKNAEDCAKTLADAASTNPKLKRALERLMATGTFAQVSMAFLPVVIPIMANHRIIPVHMAALFTDELPPIEQGDA